MSVLERGILHAGPQSEARCVPWFHIENASGGASSLLDRGGCRTIGPAYANELTVANATMISPIISFPTVPNIRPTIAALLITRVIPGSVPFELSPR